MILFFYILIFICPMAPRSEPMTYNPRQPFNPPGGGQPVTWMRKSGK